MSAHCFHLFFLFMLDYLPKISLGRTNIFFLVPLLLVKTEASVSKLENISQPSLNSGILLLHMRKAPFLTLDSFNSTRRRQFDLLKKSSLCQNFCPWVIVVQLETFVSCNDIFIIYIPTTCLYCSITCNYLLPNICLFILLYPENCCSSILCLFTQYRVLQIPYKETTNNTYGLLAFRIWHTGVFFYIKQFTIA